MKVGLLFFYVHFTVCGLVCVSLLLSQVAENVYGMFHTRYTLHRQALQHKIGYIIDVKWVLCVYFVHSSACTMVFLQVLLLFTAVCLFPYIRIKDALVLADGKLMISKAKDNMLEYTELTGQQWMSRNSEKFYFKKQQGRKTYTFDLYTSNTFSVRTTYVKYF